MRELFSKSKPRFDVTRHSATAMKSNTISQWLSLLVQFLPLSLFATYAYWNGVPTDTRWVNAFQLGAAMALLQLAILIVIKPGRPLNRLILGANMYLILGGAAVTAGWWNVMSVYANAMEAGILAAIVATGVVSSLFTRSGFVGVAGIEARNARISSAVLLLAALGALSISIIFTGDRLLAAVLPILGLAIVQRILVFRLKKTVSRLKGTAFVSRARAHAHAVATCTFRGNDESNGQDSQMLV